MPRPKKCRTIHFEPDVIYFKPRGIPLFDLDEVELTYDEIEALKLSDLDSLSQEESAPLMKISRQTFGRIIEKARGKIADALINGKAIKIIRGNHVIVKRGRIHCLNCNKKLVIRLGAKYPKMCLECSMNKMKKIGRMIKLLNAL